MLAYPKPRLYPPAINPGQLHPVRPDQILINRYTSRSSRKDRHIPGHWITVSPDIGINIARGNAAIQLTIHAVLLPLDQK